MAIREITYTLSPSGISPAAEQFGGVQGDHRATKLTFKFNGDLVTALNACKNLHFRFDAYDGEGNVCQTEGELSEDNSLEYFLEERLTRAGGKIAVVLVCTQVNDSAETKLELYNFPALLRLKNKPRGNGETSENRESYTTLLEAAKNAADSAKAIADAAKNGEFDGKDGVSATHCWNGTELTITSASGTSSVDLKGEKGDQGDQGPKGDQGPQGEPGIITNLDQAYNPESSNAQSGTAVAEAVASKMDKFGNVTETDELIEVDLVMQNADGQLIPTRFKLGNDAYIERSTNGDLIFHIGEKIFYINVGSALEGIDFNGMPLLGVETLDFAQDDAVANVGYVNKMCVPERITTTFGSYQVLENNKEYIASNLVSNVEFGYSNGSDIICSIIFTTATEGDININFPTGTKFIGGRPTFSNDETWELNIKNGVVVGGKVE